MLFLLALALAQDVSPEDADEEVVVPGVGPGEFEEAFASIKRHGDRLFLTISAPPR